MRELFGVHFLCSKKDFHSKFVRNNPWKFISVGRHCRKVNKKLEKWSCQVHGDLVVVKKACVTDCALCVANMLIRLLLTNMLTNMLIRFKMTNKIDHWLFFKKILT
jgi:hypothetical protein